jgi:hypothetical protein
MFLTKLVATAPLLLMPLILPAIVNRWCDISSFPFITMNHYCGIIRQSISSSALGRE